MVNEWKFLRMMMMTIIISLIGGNVIFLPLCIVITRIKTISESDIMLTYNVEIRIEFM